MNGEPGRAQHYLRRAYELDPQRFEEVGGQAGIACMCVCGVCVSASSREGRASPLAPHRRHRPTFHQDEELYARLGEAQHRQGRLQEAAQSYKQALAQNEANSRAALRLGVTLHDQGDPVGACRYYYEAIRVDPRNKAAFNNLGR